MNHNPSGKFKQKKQQFISDSNESKNYKRLDFFASSFSRPRARRSLRFEPTSFARAGLSAFFGLNLTMSPPATNGGAKARYELKSQLLWVIVSPKRD